jgi:murein biosynthesis integral membrane protein MurJ/undecaprenyldiphospho-muramoylpentapeptide beta-N-acetylglucosaminyltransferase
MMKKQMKVVFTGGGTGGHVYPNIAIYEAIREQYPDAAFLYLGTKTGAENRIVKNISQPIDFIEIQSRGIPQKIKSFGTLVSMAYILLGTIKSFFILRKFKPDIIVGSGGYVAAPVLFAASLLKLSVFIHEQNAVPGRLNRLIARFATKIGVSFPGSAKFFPADKVSVTGYPLRKKIIVNDEEDIKKKYQIPEGNKVLFIFGGSGGARTINQATVDILPRLLEMEDLTVILATGRGYSRDYKAFEDTHKLLQRKGLASEIPGRFIMREYFDNISEIYSIADLIIARAGAGTIKEITTVGIPSILIPKIDLPGDHQILNANEVQKAGGAKVVYEEVHLKDNRREIFVPQERLLEEIRETLFDSGQLFNMRKNLKQIEKQNSADLILKEIEGVTERSVKPEEKQIKVFYLQSKESDKTFELIFDTTTFGNTYLSDVYLEEMEEDVLFKIKNFNNSEQLILKRSHGDIKVNGEAVDKWSELREDDEIEIHNKAFTLKSYYEKVPQLVSRKSTTSKMLGSSLGIVVSRLGGFLREVFTAAFFGAGKEMDIFVIGLTLSNFIRRIVAENALENAFLPIFLRMFHRTSRKKTWESASSVINSTLLIALVFTVIGILATPLIIKVLFPVFQERGMYADTVNMTRLMFPYLFLVTVAAVLATYLKAFNRFGLAESSAVFFSVGTILGILFFYSSLGLYSLAVGVLIGGTIQILFLLPFAWKVLGDRRMEFRHKLGIEFNSPVNKKYYAQLGPITFDVLLAKTSEIVDRLLASRLTVGSVSYLYYSQTIFRLPFAIISQAINTVILKEFSDKIALFDKEKAKRLFVDGIKTNIFLLMPVSILMYILAEPVVSLLLERMNFTPEAVKSTAYALEFYSIGLIGWGIHSFTVRIFSARIDIKTSVMLNFFMLSANIALCITLVRTSLAYAGLALATSLSYLLFSIIRVIVLQSKMAKEGIVVKKKEILPSLFKTMGASLMMVIVLKLSHIIFGRIEFSSKMVENIVLIMSLAFIGISIFILCSLLLRNTEVLIFKKKLLNKNGEVPVSLLSPFKFLEVVAKDPVSYYDDYFYKINIYLSSRNWEIRNVGVKLTGLFKEKSKVNMLVEILKSRKENGFIKRNALTALRQLDVWEDEFKPLIRQLLADHYYEVRVAAINYLAKCVPPHEYDEFREVMRGKLKRSTIEEKQAALRLTARLGNAGDLDCLKNYYLHSNSLLREELLELLYNFYRRKILSADDIREHVGRVLITSNNLTPEFKLRATIKKILREIE